MVDYGNVISTGSALLIIMILGFVCTKMKIIPKWQSDAANLFAFKVGVFPLTVRILAGKNAHTLNFLPLAVGALYSLSQYAVCLVIFLLPINDKLGHYCATVFASTYINFIIAGLPIFESIWPPSEESMLPPLVLANDLVTSPIFYVLSGFRDIMQENKILEQEGKIKRKFTCSLLLSIFSRCLTNPIFIGNIFGLLYSATGLPVPKFVATIFNLLGDAVLAILFFCVGAFLSENSIISCPWYQFICCTILRLIVGPAWGILYCKLLKLPHRLAKQVVVFLAQPTAVAGYSMSRAVNIGVGPVSTEILWTSILSVPSVIMYLSIMESYHLFDE